MFNPERASPTLYVAESNAMCSLAVAGPLPRLPSAEMAASVEQTSSSGIEPLAAGLEQAGARHRLSMSPSHSKGLLNAPGQNNCFLNSAVQVLWHLDVFRRSFRHLVGHACMASACIFCSLKAIFKQFQSSDKSALPPDGLRRALARTFADQQRFQLGIMDDAAECFENILLRLHTHVAPQESVDDCRAAHCIPHRKFTMAIVEKVQCSKCGTLSEPFAYDEMVYYVSTTALVAEATAEYTAKGSCSNFARLLRQTVCKGDLRQCPGGCGASCEKQRFLQNSPDVVSIGLVWESDKAHTHHIQDTMFCIGTSLKLDELFHMAAAPHGGRVQGCSSGPKELMLVGVVCYYGMHYSTYFFHSKMKEWIYFDDAIVHQVSSSWDVVVERICKGRHQPLLLLYMNVDSRPISAATAPRTITMVEGYKWSDGTTPAPDAVSADTRRLQCPTAGDAAGQECAPEEGRLSLPNPASGGISAARGRLSVDYGSRSGGSCRRTPSVSSSSASFVHDEALFEYDTQSSVMSCDSMSLVGLECASLGCPPGNDLLECSSRSASVCRSGGRSSVPPSWTSPNLSPSSSSAFGIRRPASALSDAGRLDPPVQFANSARSRQSSTLAGAVDESVPDVTAALSRASPFIPAAGVQRSASSLSLSPRKPTISAGSESKRQVGEPPSCSPITVLRAEASDASWPSPPSPLMMTQQQQQQQQASPVYIKPPLLYGAATISAGVTSGQENKMIVGGDGDANYIDPKRVEAVLSQRLKLSRMHSLGVGDASADRGNRRHSGSVGEAESCSSRSGLAVGTKLLRPSHDLPMASSALAAAAVAAAASVQPQQRQLADGSAADSASLASSTNDSGYRSAGSTSSNCSSGGAGGSAGSWHASLRSPSSLSLPESPSTAVSDSQFDFASHDGAGSIAKASWPTAGAVTTAPPWEQPTTRRTFRPVPQPPSAAADQPHESARQGVDGASSPLPVPTTFEPTVDATITAAPQAEPAFGSRQMQVEWPLNRPKDSGRVAATAAGVGERSSRAIPPYLPGTPARTTTSTADPGRRVAGADQKAAVQLAGSQAYDTLCNQADDLLVKAQDLIENGGSDGSSLAEALVHYQQATEALKKAMLVEASDNSPALLYAQRKHDACVLQTETIRRRMAGLQNAPVTTAPSAVEYSADIACPTRPSLSDVVSSLPIEESPARAKAMTRRSPAPSVVNGAATPSRFGYSSQASVLTPRSATSQSSRASLDVAPVKAVASQPSIHADYSSSGSSSRGVGLSGCAAGATHIASSESGSRLRQPAAVATAAASGAVAAAATPVLHAAGSSSTPAGSRRLVSPRTTAAALHPSAGGAATPTSAESTPCTTPRLDGNRQPAIVGHHQPPTQLPLPSSRCGSACSSVSSSSVSSASRDFGLLPRAVRTADVGPSAGGTRLHRWPGCSSGVAADTTGQPARQPSLAAASCPRPRQPAATATTAATGPTVVTATAAAGRQLHAPLPPQAGPSFVPPSSQLTRRDIRELLVADMNKRILECPSPRGSGSSHRLPVDTAIASAAASSSSTSALASPRRRQTFSAAAGAAADATPSPLRHDVVVVVADSERSTSSQVSGLRMTGSNGGPSAAQRLAHGSSGAERAAAGTVTSVTAGSPRSLIPAPSSTLSRARLATVVRSSDGVEQQQLPAPSTNSRPAVTSGSRHGAAPSRGLGLHASLSSVRHSTAR